MLQNLPKTGGFSNELIILKGNSFANDSWHRTYAVTSVCRAQYAHFNLAQYRRYWSALIFSSCLKSSKNLKIYCVNSCLIGEIP